MAVVVTKINGGGPLVALQDLQAGARNAMDDERREFIILLGGE
jgi:hypothetical protein